MLNVDGTDNKCEFLLMFYGNKNGKFCERILGIVAFYALAFYPFVRRRILRFPAGFAFLGASRA